VAVGVGVAVGVIVAVGVGVAVAVGPAVGVGGVWPARVGVASASAAPNRIRLQKALVSRLITVVPPASVPESTLDGLPSKRFRDSFSALEPPTRYW
jgi:hypothetical protein